MNEEVPDSTFVLTEPATAADIVEVPVPEEIRTVARQVTRMGEDGWQRGEGLDSLVAIETAAERVDCPVSDLEAAIERHELLVVEDTDGERKVPAFQLAVEADVLAPVVSKVSEELAPVCASTRTVWLWFLSPKDDLGGKSPAQWLSDGEDQAPLLLTATRDARRLGR
jgi:hypothetical protein